MVKTALIFILVSAAAMAQPQLGAANLNAGWLWPKGVYTLVIHDGPGPRTEEIAALLASTGKVADFFQTLCHYTGQPWADQRTAMCFQQHVVSPSLLNRMQALHQCIGNHGQDHLNTPSLNQADTVYQIGGPASFLESYWEQQNCPALLTFPGFQTDPIHTAWLNQDSSTAGRQQGPIWADFVGSGAISTAAGPVAIGGDQDCFAKGYNQQQCQALMLSSMAQANHGGIVNIHDFDPYAKFPLDPTDLKGGYAYDYVVAILDGCQAANGGTPCVWLTPDAIPGVHRNLNVNPFSRVSHDSDDFSYRIADVVVGDINGDLFPDVLVPRNDGLYCAMNAGDGTMYPLQRCLDFSNASMIAERYWLVDVEGDKLPYLVWLNPTGMVGVKSDGHGGFHSELQLLSASFADTELHENSVFPSSIRFGAVRKGSALPEIVAMSPSGVVIATNNGKGFDPPHQAPHLTHPTDGNTSWNPEWAGKHMVLVDLFGTGALDIVIPGDAGLLYASPLKNAFSGFRPLTTKDGFNYWSSPEFYTSFDATRVGQRTAITGWTPIGMALSDFVTVDRRPTVDQFQVICSDCFLSLPGWLDQWHQSNMTASPFQSGFADLKHNGAPQAFAVWGKGLYAADISELAGYR